MRCRMKVATNIQPGSLIQDQKLAVKYSTTQLYLFSRLVDLIIL